MQIQRNLTHAKPNAVCSRTSESTGQNVCMGGMEIAKSETPDVLGTSIRSDLRWDDHVFNVSKETAKCLGFLKRCKKYFTPYDLRTIFVTYIRPKMGYNSHLWSGASKCALDFMDRIQSRALKLIGGDRVATLAICNFSMRE